MKKFSLFLPIVILFGVVSWVIYSFIVAYVPKKELLQGQIEAQSYSISSKVAGRIEEVHVKKGDFVKKGDLIFSIYSPELEAKITQVKATQNAAIALSSEAQKGSRKQQIAAAFDQYQKAKVALELDKTTYERVKALYAENVISKQKMDEAYTKFKASEFSKNAAYELYKMAKEGARDETKAAALAKEKAAAGAVAEVSAYADDLKITSFYDALVTNVMLQSGELAPSGFPVVQVTDLKNAWAIFHVREDKLKDFKQGQVLKLFIPALQKEFDFKISFISALGSFASWRVNDASAQYDLQTFEVHARPIRPIDDLRVGMSVLLK